MLSRRFENSVAIVTGAGQGIGLEIATLLAQEGAHVILNDIEEGLVREAAQKISKENGACIPVAGDVSKTSVIQSLVDEAVNRYGKLDIAIANAGITLFGDFLDYNEDDFYRVVKVNMGGSFFLAQAAARQMKTQYGGGKILFMSSVTAHQAHKSLGAYGMTKAGIEMLAKNLVVELSTYKINVNAIAPGATLTERTLADKNYEGAWAELTPLGKAATVKDIANAALFLVSPQADHITGQTIIIDGGWSGTSPSPF